MPDGLAHLRPSRLKLVAAFAAIYTIWGSTYLAIRYAIETMPPFLMAGVRFLIAGSILYLWARKGGAARPSRAHWQAATVVGALLFLGGNGSLTWAELRVPSGLAALLLSIIPIWMVLLGSFERHGVKLRPKIVVGLAFGLAGIMLLVSPNKLFGRGRVDPAGAAVLLMGSICWAAGSLYARRANLPTSTLLATSLEMLAGGMLLVIMGLVTGEAGKLSFVGISLRSALGLVYLITFGALLGFTSYNWLLGHTTPARISTYAYVNPVVAVLLGWAVAGEPVTPRTLLAAAVIVSAVVLILTHAPQPAPQPREDSSLAQTQPAAVVPCD